MNSKLTKIYETLLGEDNKYKVDYIWELIEKGKLNKEELKTLVEKGIFQTLY